MTECRLIAERAPRVIRDGAEWTPDERAHLEECRECQAELALVEAARHLGNSVARGLDPLRISAAALRRLREEESPPRVLRVRRPRVWLLTAAAAAMVVLAVQVTAPDRAPSGETPVAAGEGGSVLSELDELSSQELQSVLEALGPAAGGVTVVEPAPLADLNPQELERVLQAESETKRAQWAKLRNARQARQRALGMTEPEG